MAISILLVFHASAPGATTNDYRTVSSGDWSTVGAWERYNGSSWVAAVAAPTSAANAIAIRNGHSIEVTSGVTVDQFTIESGGNLIVASGVIFTVANGTGDDLTITGSMDNQGTIQFNGSTSEFKILGTLKNSGTINGVPYVLTGGVYQHNFSSTVGYMPACYWFSGSTLEVIGYTSYTGTMSVGAQTFANVTWNCPDQTGAIVLASQFNNMTGLLTISSTGSGSLVMNNTTLGETFSFTGGYTQMGGIVDLASSSGATTLYISGDVYLAGGTITETGSATRSFFSFAGSSEQELTVSPGFVFSNLVGMYIYPSATVTLTQLLTLDDATLAVGGRLNCGAYVVSGPSFSLASAGTLSIGHSNGITASSADGNIQTTSRSFSTAGYYVYNCASGMSYSGDGLPSTVARLSSSNSGGSLVLQHDVTVSEQLTLDQPMQLGTLGEYNLVLESGGTLSGSSYVCTGGTGKFARYFPGAGTYAFPVGTTGAYTPCSVTLSGGSYTSAHLDVNVHATKHSSNSSSTNYLNRYWAITSGGISGATYSASFTYVDGDIAGSEPALYCGRYSGSEWILGNATTTGTNTMSIDGQTSFSDFTGGESGAVPVQISLFAANRADAGVRLTWTTLSEVNNYGFYVQRRSEAERVFSDIPDAFIPGNGTTAAQHEYSYTDADASTGSRAYRLRQVDLNGAESFTQEVLVETATDVAAEELPTTFALAQNFPNPFNPKTVVSCQLSVASNVRLSVFDMLGREVAVLINEQKAAGKYAATWDASGMASGVYYYRLTTSGFTDTKRMLLLR
jgi:hypothetical protein